MYLIPRNISNKFEFFPGWGWKELLILLVGLGIGGVISLLLGLITPSPARFLPILFFGGIGYVASQPVLADGSSALQIIKYYRQFKSGQKLYLYEKGGI